MRETCLQWQISAHDGKGDIFLFRLFFAEDKAFCAQDFLVEWDNA